MTAQLATRGRTTGDSKELASAGHLVEAPTPPVPPVAVITGPGLTWQEGIEVFEQIRKAREVPEYSLEVVDLSGKTKPVCEDEQGVEVVDLRPLVMADLLKDIKTNLELLGVRQSELGDWFDQRMQEFMNMSDGRMREIECAESELNLYRLEILGMQQQIALQPPQVIHHYYPVYAEPASDIDLLFSTVPKIKLDWKVAVGIGVGVGVLLTIAGYLIYKNYQFSEANN